MKKGTLPFTHFAREVLNLRLTKGQRVLCRVAFDGVDPCDLPAEDRELAALLFGRLDRVPDIAKKIVALELGRDSGKTLIAASKAVHSMVTSDLSTRGPGDVPVAVVVAPRQRTARHTIRIARALVRGCPALERLVTAETSDGFSLRRPDGWTVALEAFAMSEGGASVRGRSILDCIVDEAQFLRSDEAYAATDRDLHAAVSPRLLGKLTMISTRWPSPTLMRELVDKNLGAPSTCLAARGDTLTMRDHDPRIKETIERELLIDEGNARREFFCDDSATFGSSFFDHRTIATAIKHDRPLSITSSSPLIAAGSDIGLLHDSSAIAIVAREGDRYILLDVHEMKPHKGEPLRLSRVISEFAEVMRRHGVRSFVADGHVREPAREFADAEKVAIEPAPEGARGKEETYVLVRKLLSEGRIELPNHARLLDQLRSVIAKPLEGGGMKISIPRRAGLAHGDLVSAFVLAVHSLASVGTSSFYLPRVRRDAYSSFAHSFGSRRGF